MFLYVQQISQQENRCGERERERESKQLEGEQDKSYQVEGDDAEEGKANRHGQAAAVKDSPL